MRARLWQGAAVTGLDAYATSTDCPAAVEAIAVTLYWTPHRMPEDQRSTVRCTMQNQLLSQLRLIHFPSTNQDYQPRYRDKHHDSSYSNIHIHVHTNLVGIPCTPGVL